MWCSRGCLGTPAISDAWLCHVSIVGGPRRRGCAAGGVPVSFRGLLGADDAAEHEPRAVVGDRLAADAPARLVPAVGADDRREHALGEDARIGRRVGAALGLRLLDQVVDEALVGAT